MAEQEVEAAWRAELERIGETQHHDAPKLGELKRRRHFVGLAMKPKRGGFRRSKLTTI